MSVRFRTKRAGTPAATHRARRPPAADEQQGDIAGHKRSPSDMDNRPFDSTPPAMAGGSRSGFRPTGLLVGLHKTGFTHLGARFFLFILWTRQPGTRVHSIYVIFRFFLETR